MSRDIEELVRKHRVENEYRVAEAMASGIVAAWRGLEQVAARVRTWVAPRGAQVRKGTVAQS